MDTVSKETRSWVMSRVKSKGSQVELIVIRALKRSSRTRFLTHSRNLPGCPDIAFPKLKLAIFVNGCFWHWHGCARCRMPASNRIYWQAKIARNAKRDKRTARKLNAQGWHYVNIWECDFARGISRALRKVELLKQGAVEPGT